MLGGHLPWICEHNKLLHPVFPEKNELNNSIAAHPMRSFHATIVVRLDISKSFSCHTPHFHELNAPLDDWNTKPRPPAMKWLKKLLPLFIAIGGDRRVIAGWGCTSVRGSLYRCFLLVQSEPRSSTSQLAKPSTQPPALLCTDVLSLSPMALGAAQVFSRIFPDYVNMTQLHVFEYHAIPTDAFNDASNNRSKVH